MSGRSWHRLLAAAFSVSLAILASLAIASPVGAFWLGSNDALAAGVFHAGGQQGIVLAEGLGEDRARVSVAFPTTAGVEDARFLVATAGRCDVAPGHRAFRLRFPVQAAAAFAHATVTVTGRVRAYRLYDGSDASGPLLACAPAILGVPTDETTGVPMWAAARFGGGGVLGTVIVTDDGDTSTVSVALDVGSSESTWRVIGSSRKCAFQHHQTDLEFFLERTANPHGTIFAQASVALHSLSDLRSVRLRGGAVNACKTPTQIEFPN